MSCSKTSICAVHTYFLGTIIGVNMYILYKSSIQILISSSCYQIFQRCLYPLFTIHHFIYPILLVIIFLFFFFFLSLFHFTLPGLPFFPSPKDHHTHTYTYIQKRELSREHTECTNYVVERICRFLPFPGRSKCLCIHFHL